jgi:hypothetical protein
MQDLRVIGVENGALLVVSDDGERFRIPIDEMMQSKLRQSLPAPGTDRKLSPREIQAHIRGGMSAQDVASLTGVSIEYIEKYEGPVMAEREFVIESALGVPVHTALETDPNGGNTFGSVITARLEGLHAEDERWASWKEEGIGWIVKLAFTAEQIDHDARWHFDPKKVSLAPLNSEAVTLSQQGEATGVLIPRLRAVTSDRQADTSRFDSGAFLLDDVEPASNFVNRFAQQPPAEAPRPVAPSPAAEAASDKNQTSDLLEALRRRRGERESASYEDETPVAPAQDHPSTGIRLVDVPLDYDFDAVEPESAPAEVAPDAAGNTTPLPHLPSKPARKGRTAMPSWDDIVFGARPDDDFV